MASKTVYLSLGSNLGDRLEYLTQATRRLDNCFSITVTKTSSVYETAAWGLANQDDFLNIALEIATDLAPMDLLSACQKIELELDRTREIHWGPRTIDIDILLYEDVEMNTDNLIIPHKHLLERAFVTIPLAEIEPKIMVKGVAVASVVTNQTCVDTGFRVEIS